MKIEALAAAKLEDEERNRLIERVARAICVGQGDDPGGMALVFREIPRSRNGFPIINKRALVPVWHHYLNQATDAIAEIEKWLRE